MFKSYKDLRVWQKSIKLVVDIYKVSSSFPSTEQYTLTSQIRRSSLSVPSNIAEGHARGSSREFLRFIAIALGSLAEMETQLILASELGFINNKNLETITVEADEIGRMLRGLQQSLQAKLAPSPESLAS